MPSDRAQQVPKPHVYGNFKKPKTPKRMTNSKRAQKRAGMSADHLACIRKLPCCVSLKTPAGECHHLKGTGERGIGLRSTDRWGLPLSHELHMDLERAGSRNEVRWFREHGIENPHALAAALWANTGDLGKMIAVIIAHRKGGAR